MQAAYADGHLFAMISECSRLDGTAGMSIDEAAHELRNWDDKAEATVERYIERIANEGLRTDAEDAVARYGKLKQRRNRVIHDALEVGIFGTEQTGYVTKPLSVEYRRDRHAKITKTWLHEVTPEEIAKLACQLFEVQQDLDAIVCPSSGFLGQQAA